MTLDDIVDELFIYKRTHSPEDFQSFLIGLNDKEALEEERERTGKRSGGRASSSSSQGSRRQRIGDSIFEERSITDSDRESRAFFDGLRLARRLEPLFIEGTINENDIDALFNRQVRRIPAYEKYTEVEDERLRRLFSYRVVPLYIPDDTVGIDEIQQSLVFSVRPDLHGKMRTPPTNIEELTIEQMLDEFKPYANERVLAMFRELTASGEDTVPPTDEQLQDMQNFFRSLNRGDNESDERTLLRVFVAQCKAAEEGSLHFLEPTARKYVYFLVQALKRFLLEEMDVTPNLHDEGELKSYDNFLKFWLNRTYGRFFNKLVKLDNRTWNDRYSLYNVRRTVLEFYSRFVPDITRSFGTGEFLDYLGLGSPKELPASPIDFPVKKALMVIERLGEKTYLKSLMNNMMSWLIEADDDLRIVFHDVEVLVMVLKQAFKRLNMKNDLRDVSPTEFVKRRDFIAYLEYFGPDSHVVRNYVNVIIPKAKNDGFNGPFSFDEEEASAASSSELVPTADDIGDSITTTTVQFNPARARLDHGIIVREASYLDRRKGTPNRSHRDLYHVAAYKDTAIGCAIGYASYDTKAKKLVEFDATEDRVGTALIGALRRAHPSHAITRSDASTIGDEMSASSSSSSSSSDLLSLDLSYTYESLLAEAGQTNERPYVLMLWLSQSYSSTPPIVINVEKTRSGRQTLMFSVNRNYIPEHVSLNVDCYSHFTSETGNSMKNLAGSASVPLAKLVRTSGRAIMLDLKVAASSVRKVKGRLSLKCNRSSLQPGGSSVVDQYDVDANDSLALVKEYIESNRSFYGKHPPISRSIAHTTVFKFRCRQHYVPGALFDNFRIPSTQETYYLNALKNALQLRLPQTPIVDVEEAWQRVDSKLYTVLNMLTSYAVACKYLRDSVDNNTKGGGQWSAQRVEEIDSFDTVRHTDNGDCEDKTKEILLHAMGLKHDSKDFVSPVFAEIREILDNFIFCSTLCAVSHSSISKTDYDKRRDILDEHMGAHECAVAVPNYTFFSALKRSSPDHELFSLYTQEEQERGKGERLYILEGTGSLAPEPRDSTEYRDDTAIAYEQVDERHLTAQLFYDIESDDVFYKIIVNLMTPEFYLRTGYIGFEFLVINERGERGAFFVDLMHIDKNTNVRITETPRLSPLAFNRSMRITEDNFPLVALEAPLEIPRALLATAERLTFQSDRTRTVPKHEDCFIVQCLFEYMTEEKIVSIIKNARAQKLNVVCYVEALKLDYITKQVFGRYTLIFY